MEAGPAGQILPGRPSAAIPQNEVAKKRPLPPPPSMTQGPNDDDSDEQNDPENVQERHIIIAVWNERNKAVLALEPNDERTATKAEEEADEAVCVTVQEDGSLKIARANHSVGRSLAVLGVKLMIVLPIGLRGAVAIVNATEEVEAATRDRERTEFAEEELNFLVEKMKPGWSALIGVYKEYLVPVAVEALLNLGAVAVWNAKESAIRELVENTKLEEDKLPSHGVPLPYQGRAHDKSKDNLVEREAKTCCSKMLASIKRTVCCCATCFTVHIADWL